ncbi:MAG TPA: hypothetical protein V6D15_10875 [Oculatellaceae cyanobacterium]
MTNSKNNLDLQESQEEIYRFWLALIKQWSPEDVLIEFKKLFIDCQPNKINTDALKSLNKLIFANDEAEFINTIKRSCYILINNWDASRNYKYIKELLELFLDKEISKKSLSLSVSRLRRWLNTFVNSKDYQALQVFVSKYETNNQTHWANRYTPYLLVTQYADLNNPIEQREAAKALYKKLKEKFKFDLAMYTVRSQSAACKYDMPENPTNLGDEVLRIIKTIVGQKNLFDYTNLSHIFLEQTENVFYSSFKINLIKYLNFAGTNKEFAEILTEKLTEKFAQLYEEYDEDVIDEALILRTCNRVIEYITTENKQEPTQLFVLLIAHGSPLNLVIVLLKIILICRNSRIHMENCIGNLIEYYRNQPEEDCKWIISFMEIFNITFAIYAEDVHYNLVSMENEASDTQLDEQLEAYRIFAQIKPQKKIELSPEQMTKLFNQK